MVSAGVCDARALSLQARDLAPTTQALAPKADAQDAAGPPSRTPRIDEAIAGSLRHLPQNDDGVWWLLYGGSWKRVCGLAYDVARERIQNM